MVVSTRLEVHSQNSSTHNTRRRHHQCPRVPTCSHRGSSNDELTNNTVLRYHDPIIFSCNRANEFESGCEDDVNCACTVKVNCRNMRTLCNSEWDRRSALLDWESDHSPYHEGFKQIRVVSRLKPPIQTCPVSHEHFNLPATPHRHVQKKKTVQLTKFTAMSHAVSDSRFARQRLDEDLHATPIRGHSEHCATIALQNTVVQWYNSC